VSTRKGERMSIGLYDADMAAYTLVPFNLELMKLSAYYKKQREMVLLAKEFDPTRNTKFFYIKDWDDGNFPSSLNANNVTYLGKAFTNDIYKPLDLNIEKCVPDTSIYSIMESIVGQATKTSQTLFNNMMNGEHCRLSLDGQTIWSDYMCQFNNLETTKLIMIHDYDLGQVEGAFETVQDILSQTKRNPSIGFKFAPQLNNIQDLMNWSSLRANCIFYSMGFNGLMPLADFYKWCANGYGKNAYAMLEYNITPKSFTQNDFTDEYLCQILKQVIISRSYRLKISLIYNDDLLSNNYQKQILDLLNFYQHSMFSSVSDALFIKEVQNDTVFDFAKKSLDTYGKYPKMLNRYDMRALFHYIQENYPQLFKNLYELTYIKLKEEINDSIRN